jgi:hypothetical protein
LIQLFFSTGSHFFFFFLCLGLVSGHDPITYASHVAGITGAHHHTWLICWDEVMLTFFPGWPQTRILPISTSQVAGIIGVNHHPWPL